MRQPTKYCECGKRMFHSSHKCRRCYEKHKQCFECWEMDLDVYAELRAKKERQLIGDPLYERPEIDLDADSLIHEDWTEVVA